MIKKGQKALFSIRVKHFLVKEHPLERKKMKLLNTILIAIFIAISGSAFADEPKDKVKAGFIYVGPTGDHGWTYRHDIGRQDVENHFGDRVETIFVESVTYGPDATRVMRQMAMKGVDIIFATS